MGAAGSIHDVAEETRSLAIRYGHAPMPVAVDGELTSYELASLSAEARRAYELRMAQARLARLSKQESRLNAAPNPVPATTHSAAITTGGQPPAAGGPEGASFATPTGAAAVASEWNLVSWLESGGALCDLAKAILGANYGSDELTAMRELGGSANLESVLLARLAKAVSLLSTRLAPPGGLAQRRPSEEATRAAAAGNPRRMMFVPSGTSPPPPVPLWLGGDNT